MRILIIASEVPPTKSGVARSVGEVATRLEDRGHTVQLLSAADATGVRWDRLRLSGAGLRVRSYLASEEPFDVINVHGPAPTISDAALAQLVLRSHVPAPVVYTHHFSLHFAVPGVDAAGRAYEAVMRRVAARCDAVVTTTHEYAQMFRSRQDRLAVIPWGVELELFEPGGSPYDGSRPLRALAIGQFRRYKGMAVAVRAIAGQPQLALSLVGTGPLVDNVMGNAAGADNVEYLGALGDAELREVIRAHDVILLPSRMKLEAFGIVLLEGMASGCVPVASDLPGVREVVGDVGLTARPGSPESLRAQLLRLANDPEDVERRKKLAVETAQSYTWDNTADAYERLFLQVARSGPRETP